MKKIYELDRITALNIFKLLGEHPVILCIGSDRVTGDCLGPIVGDLLIKQNISAYVYGTLSHPVTALNLEEMLRFIKQRHADKKILAIDSSVGKACDIGQIRVIAGALKPGSADGKKLPKVGDISITATVTDTKLTPLCAVRLGLVFSLAENIVNGLMQSFPSLNYSTLKNKVNQY